MPSQGRAAAWYFPGGGFHPCQVPCVVKAMGREVGLPRAVVVGLSGHRTRARPARDTIAADLELPAIRQAGQWTSTALVNRYGKRPSARRSGATQRARLQGRA